MATHELKVWSEYMPDLINGKKKFELRFNDRDFKVGDTLLLRGWDKHTEQYTGVEIERYVYYILHGPAFGLEKNHVIMSLSND
jgi:ASC-1-like (ASCH) protein